MNEWNEILNINQWTMIFFSFNFFSSILSNLFYFHYLFYHKYQIIFFIVFLIIFF